MITEDWDRRKPLHLAAARGYEAAIMVLLEAGADPNARDIERRTPLHEAVKSGNVTAVNRLIECAAEVHYTDKEDKTPLHHAASNGTVLIIEALSDWGADANALSKQSRNALHYACDSTEASVSVIQALFRYKTDINAVDQKGRTPFHYAARKCLVDIVRTLLNNRARSDIKDASGAQPLTLVKQCMQLDRNDSTTKAAQQICALLQRTPSTDRIVSIVKPKQANEASAEGIPYLLSA